MNDQPFEAMLASARTTNGESTQIAKSAVSSPGECLRRPVWSSKPTDPTAPINSAIRAAARSTLRNRASGSRAPSFPFKVIVLSSQSLSMRRRSQNPNQLELFDFRRSQEVCAEACFPMRFQIRDAVLRMAHLNARFIVEVVNQQNGDKPPVASIADCSGYARVERTGPNPIWIGLVQFSFKHLNTRRRALGSRTGRRNGLSLPMRPQITESETGSQQHHPGD